MINMSEKEKFIKKLEAERDLYNKRIEEYKRRKLEVMEGTKLTQTAKYLLVMEFSDIIQYDLGKVKKIDKLIEDIILL